MNKKNLPFWLMTLSVGIALILPVLLRDGMFMDGLLYSVISRNLAEGKGTFWNPHLTRTIFNSFHEHPPLVFGIQSLFFRMLGDHLLVERFYSFLTAIITGYFITLIWKSIFKPERQLANLSWLPFLFWIIIPLTSWSYKNNMLENSMGIFTIASVFILIRGLSANRKIFFDLMAAGLFIFAGFLSKGLVALFPLAVIGFYWLIFKNSSFLKAAIYTLILILVPALLFFLITLNREAYQSLSQYFNAQIIPSLKGQRAVTERYYLVQRLFKELLPLIILTAAASIVYKLKKVGFAQLNAHKNWMLLLFGIGLSASLPMAISPKQSGFYLVPSFPYFAIGFAIIAAPGLNELIQKFNPEKKGFKIYRWLSLILLIAVAAFSILQIGKTGRDHEKLKDVYAVGKTVPRGAVINICPSMWEDWALHGYFARYFDISLDPSDKEHEYYLADKSYDSSLAKNYTKINLSTGIYDLYRIKR
jgi:4-amino-4-deoxy-L-arabinose transferase-like glycosyltransferase